MNTEAKDARIAELERQVTQLTQQYAYAMSELDALAYAVSHDLRAPLRSLSGFSQALLEFNEADKDKTRHFLERIQQASARLSELIDALLSLSRISRADMHARDIDLTRLSKDAAATIAARYPNRTIDLTIAPALSCNGDPRLLRTAVELLLDNAFKFTATRPAPTIEIGQTTEGEFYIADNGVGFDPAYTDKLFKPFHRLHTGSQFTGTGIGLAAVQRIVGRHGGTVRVDGKLDGGATAFFALPSPQGTPTSSSS